MLKNQLLAERQMMTGVCWLIRVSYGYILGFVIVYWTEGLSGLALFSREEAERCQ